MPQNDRHLEIVCAAKQVKIRTADAGEQHVDQPSPQPTSYSLSVALAHSWCFETCTLNDEIGGMDAKLMGGATCTPGDGIVLEPAEGGPTFLEVASVFHPPTTSRVH